MIVIPKGTEVTCPKCGEVMLRTKVDLLKGDVLSSDVFEPVGTIAKNGRFAECPNEKAPYVKTIDGVTKVHTKDGWK